MLIEFNQFFDNFLQLIESRHHGKLIPSIISEVEKIDQDQVSGKTVVLVAQESDAETHRADIESHTDVINGGYQVEVDPNIVGGYVVRSETAQIDASYRTRLVELYNQLTA